MKTAFEAGEMATANRGEHGISDSAFPSRDSFIDDADAEAGDAVYHDDEPDDRDDDRDTETAAKKAADIMGEEEPRSRTRNTERGKEESRDSTDDSDDEDSAVDDELEEILKGIKLDSDSSATDDDEADAATDDKEPEAESPDPLKFELDPELVDEDVIGAFNKLADFTRGLMGRLEQIESQYGSQRESQAISRLDAMFSSVNKPIRELVGEGGLHALDPSSPEYKTRLQVVRTMRVLQDGYQKAGQKVSAEKLFEQSLRVNLPEQMQKQDKRRVHSEVSKRVRSSLNRPASRANADLLSTDPKDPTQAAEDKVAAKMGQWFD